MRTLLCLSTLLTACAADFVVTLRPTTPAVQSSLQPVAVESRRVRVTSLDEADAISVAEGALLDGGWTPTRFADFTADRDDARFVIRSVRTGLDAEHPIDGCSSGTHAVPYFVEIDAALEGADDRVLWTGRARVRSTDLLPHALEAEAYPNEALRCDHISPLHPIWSLHELRDYACVEGALCPTQQSHNAPLVKLALERLVGALGQAVRVSASTERPRSISLLANN
jgi:hypothetical protein